MALSWTEIKDRALRFANEWKNDTSEDAEAKSFWDEFFTVFSVSRRRLAQFEKAVERPGRSKGFVDLFWPGTLVVEHKSRGRSLDDAYKQAVDYFVGLKDHELPRYVLVSDFARFRLYDPLTMPPALVNAHQDLDRAVDQCYRPAAFPTEARRIEFLFELYEQYTAPLIAAAGVAGKKKKGR